MALDFQSNQILIQWVWISTLWDNVPVMTTDIYIVTVCLLIYSGILPHLIQQDLFLYRYYI